MTSYTELTDLLISWSEGDQTALERLVPLVERELHHMAHRYMNREKPGHTLQTTALLDEAFVRLMDQKRVRWQNRAHFFAIAARIMRRILLNHARDQNRLKRGGGAIQVPLSQAEISSTEKSDELIALDNALNVLEQQNERQSRIVELRYFGGLTVEETAEVLKISTATVMREWKSARAWIALEIKNGK